MPVAVVSEKQVDESEHGAEQDYESEEGYEYEEVPRAEIDVVQPLAVTARLTHTHRNPTGSTDISQPVVRVQTVRKRTVRNVTMMVNQNSTRPARPLNEKGLLIARSPTLFMAPGPMSPWNPA